MPGYNYAGPGTALEKRLDENDKPLPNSKPINRVDEAAYTHDLAYRAAGDASETNALTLKHEADKKMIAELNNIENPTFRERIDAPLVRTALQAKVRLGLGVGKPSLAAVGKTKQNEPKSDKKPSLAAELYKPFRKPKEYLTVKVFNLNDIWTADLMFMHDLKVLVVMALVFHMKNPSAVTFQSSEIHHYYFSSELYEQNQLEFYHLYLK